ncbi:DKNYY domain-containing protein [Acinetobacter bereziniae]|uniref:DKNYY domain-containing protein n=1 Tax=Acinetobacter bereziniae TaxID=106648 RepID=UPI00124FE682|nr:DKNYY domain-containing protein [Acinetobacter bereziniae]
MACSPKSPPVYKIQGDAVYFIQYGWDEKEKPLLVSRDVKNFKTINNLYAKDSTTMYYLGKVLQGADPNSFTFLGGVRGLVSTDGYSKDSHTVYFLGKPLVGADPMSFVLFENAEAFARDKQHVYLKGDVFKQLNAATAESLGSGYWSELNKLYYYSTGDLDSTKPVLTLISNQFDGKYKQLNEYFLSKQEIFKAGKKTSFDPGSFQVLAEKDIGNTCFSYVVASLVSDKNGTWLEGKKLPVHLQSIKGYTNVNVFESDRHELYAFSRDDGLKKLGLKSQLTLMNGDNGILIQGGKKPYLLDQYQLRDMSDSISARTKLSVYAPLDGTLMLTDGKQLYTFDGSLHTISSGMPRLIYIDDDTAVFEGKDGEILNVSQGGVMGNNPIHNNSYPFDASGMKYIGYNKLLAELMKQKNIELDEDEGMFLVKKYITFSDASPAISINEKQYKQLLMYVVSDKEWEKIRKEKVSLYLSKSAQGE